MSAPIRSHRSADRAGLSTIEMVTVIALTGILSVALAGLLRHPMQGHAAVSRRAELVELADLALLRLSRDLRMALPNGVRVSDARDAIELLHVAAGARYRAEPGINPSGIDHTPEADWLSFGGDARWNLLGRLDDLDFAYGTPLAAGTRIAIHPTGSGIWAAAAADSSSAPITASTNRVTLVDDGDEDQIVLASAHRFDHPSPQGRLYLVDGPISYLCDAAGSALWRVEGYAVTASQPTRLADAPLAAGRTARATDRLERCRFDYAPGTPARSGLVTIELVLSSEGERVRLLHQVPIPHAP